MCARKTPLMHPTPRGTPNAIPDATLPAEVPSNDHAHRGNLRCWDAAERRGTEVPVGQSRVCSGQLGVPLRGPPDDICSDRTVPDQTEGRRFHFASFTETPGNTATSCPCCLTRFGIRPISGRGGDLPFAARLFPLRCIASFAEYREFQNRPPSLLGEIPRKSCRHTFTRISLDQHQRVNTTVTFHAKSTVTYPS